MLEFIKRKQDHDPITDAVWIRHQTNVQVSWR